MTATAALRTEAAARGLTIGAPTTWTLARAIDGDAARASLWAEGYFTSPPSLPPVLVARCRDAIELVRAADAPPLASFAFDAPWELAALLAEHAAAALGGAIRLMPAFWAWRLDAHDGRGWAPHRDRTARDIDDDGKPETLALWVPLTDATADNGCMYVVPAPWDPMYPNPRATAEVMFVQAIRALPAPAGSVMGWTSRLLHWGAMARPGSPPRISLSFEYQDAARPAIDGEMFEPGWIPPVDRRRALIEAQWPRYAHLHGGSEAQWTALGVALDHLFGP